MGTVFVESHFYLSKDTLKEKNMIIEKSNPFTKLVCKFL